MEEEKILEFKVVCDDETYMPSYANNTDACMDLKAKLDCDLVTLTHNDSIVVGTGVQVSVPDGYVMLIFPRSSTGIKLHCRLMNGTGVIDSGYRDEIKLAITNFGDNEVDIKDGQRIAQFMVIPRPYLDLKVVKDDEEFRHGDRLGGIGSTGE